MQRRRFTLEEANSLVPWLERTIQRLNSSLERLEDLRRRWEELQKDQRRLNGTFDSYHEINVMKAELDEMGEDMQQILDTIGDEGIIIRDLSTGLVDFPHIRQGREVYLCWIIGEKRIEYWHETDSGFAHRQLL